MDKFIPPLTVIFIWHPKTKIENESIKESLIEPLARVLSRDKDKPFSRSVNLPVFFYTAEKNCEPPALPILDEKTLVIPFIDIEMVCDDKWVSTIENMIDRDDKKVIIPVALDKAALNLRGSSKNKQLIRAFDFKNYVIDNIFIGLAGAICRKLLNLANGEKMQLFLSHTKHDERGVKIAQTLKNFIDNNTTLNSFFDTNDILYADDVNDTLVENIKKSIFIVIHTDNYSARYYCQYEILQAKQENRPIITVDALEKIEDRYFQFTVNIPCVHINHNSEMPVTDLFEVLKVALIETLRHNYSYLLLAEYENKGWINKSALKLCRPPEASDIKKIFDNTDKNTQYTKDETKYVIYPDPPVYPEEIAFLKSIGISANTPLTSDMWGLKEKRIGVSISEPSNEELLKLGQTEAHLTILSREIARYLLCCNVTLIYGGHLTEGGFTDFICQEIRILQNRLNNDQLRLYDYVAWPIYVNDSEEIKTWIADNRKVLERINVPPPSDILALIPNKEQYLPPQGAQNKFVWSLCLTEMRKKMIIKSDDLKDGCDARICAGGKLSGYKSMLPGVLEEILIAGKQNLPIYLVGGFGGVTAKVCEARKTGKLPEELTLDWQKRNNPELEETLTFVAEKHNSYYTEIMDTYENLSVTLSQLELHNGLSKEDNERLFASQYVDEIMFLILKGLNSVFNKMDYLVETYPALKRLKDDSNTTPTVDTIGYGKNDMYNRTMLSIELLTWVRNGGWKNYDRFTERQENNKLSWKSFGEIQEYTKSIIKNDADYNAMLAYLIITSLDKAKSDMVIKSCFDESNVQLGSTATVYNNTQLYVFLEKIPGFSETFSGLSDEYRKLILDGLKTIFNMVQFIQSENLPEHLEPLSKIGKASFDFYMLHTLYTIGGIEGHVSRQGSRIIDESFWVTIQSQ